MRMLRVDLFAGFLLQNVQLLVLCPDYLPQPMLTHVSELGMDLICRFLAEGIVVCFGKVVFP